MGIQILNGIGRAWTAVTDTVSAAQETLNDASAAAKNAKELTENPRMTAREVALGALDAASTSLKPRVQVEGTASTSLGSPTEVEGKDAITLFHSIQTSISQGMWDLAATSIESLLSNAVVIEPNSAKGKEKENLKEAALQQLKKVTNEGGSLTETVQAIFKILNKQQIVCAGVPFNSRESDPKLREKRFKVERQSKNAGVNVPSTDGVRPEHILEVCRQAFCDLRYKYKLNIPTSPEPPPILPKSPSRRSQRSSSTTAQNQKKEMTQLINETDKKIDQFCKKTVHYSTMHALCTLFGSSIQPNEFNTLLQEDSPKAAFLKKVGGGRFRQFVYKHSYCFIFGFISPFIDETIKGVTTHLRTFIKKELHSFMKTQIGQLNDYFMLIERRLDQYFNTQTSHAPGGNAGSFENYLKQTVVTYGERELTEAQVIKLFGNYIVKHYTPRPEITINGYRLPLISHTLEWVVHSFRKILVRFFLRYTQLINNILTRGTDSIPYAQLGLKQVLADKLQEVQGMIDSSRSRTVTDLSSSKEETSSLRSEVRDVQNIILDLHPTIQTHSEQLLRFIEIEACNGSLRNLRALKKDIDHENKSWAENALQIAQTLLQLKPFAIQAVLEEATTTIIETALTSILEDSERQIESQLQGIFKTLEDAYNPNDNRNSDIANILQENASMDKELRTRLNTLSTSAIKATIDNHVKTASVEKHREIEAFVARIKDDLEAQANFIAQLQISFQALLTKNPQPSITEIKEALNHAMAEIEGYRKRIHSMLDSQDFKKCYSDIQADLHNGFAVIADKLRRLAVDIFEPMLLNIKSIEQAEKEKKDCEEANQKLANFSLDLPNEEAKKQLKQIRDVIPEARRAPCESLLGKLNEQWNELVKVKENLRRLDDVDQLEAEAEALSQKIQQIQDVRQKLTALSTAVQKTHKPQAAKQSRNSLHLLRELVAIDDHDLQTNVLQSLQSEKLEDVFHTSRWTLSLRRTPTIFLQLERYNKELMAMKEQKQKELESAQEATQSLNREQLEQNKDELSRSLNENKTTLNNVLLEQIEAISEEKNAAFNQLKEGTLSFEARGNTIKKIAQVFKVSGCIAVGELKLIQKLPSVTGLVVPIITQKVETLLKALSNPFHFRQLSLRLVLLDFANKQAS